MLRWPALRRSRLRWRTYSMIETWSRAGSARGEAGPSAVRSRRYPLLNSSGPRRAVIPDRRVHRRRKFASIAAVASCAFSWSFFSASTAVRAGRAKSSRGTRRLDAVVSARLVGSRDFEFCCRARPRPSLHYRGLLVRVEGPPSPKHFRIVIEIPARAVAREVAGERERWRFALRLDPCSARKVRTCRLRCARRGRCGPRP